MQRFTASPIGAVPCAAELQLNNLPEWLRPKDACKRFGVSLSWLYQRLAEDRFKSTSLRNRGAVKGIRHRQRRVILETFTQQKG